MKVRFLSHCRDKLTREHYLEGRVVDLPDDRARQAIDKGHAVHVAEPQRKPGRPPKDKAAGPSEDK